MKTNKIIAIILALCCVMSVFLAVPAFAAEDNFPYSFELKSSMGSSYSSDGYNRETSYPDNPWKVNMTYSSEGQGTAAYYWIATSIVHTQCSNRYLVTQGSGDNYFRAYDDIQNKTVKLGVKNNNNVSQSYEVAGYWDEEVGVIMNDLPL